MATKKKKGETSAKRGKKGWQEKEVSIKKKNGYGEDQLSRRQTRKRGRKNHKDTRKRGKTALRRSVLQHRGENAMQRRGRKKRCGRFTEAREDNLGDRGIS